MKNKKNGTKRIQVEAYDGGNPSRSSYLIVNITVLDSNDNPPIFENTSYEIHVLEGENVGETLIKLCARDADKGLNGLVEYRFTDETTQKYGHLFKINKSTGQISTVQALDFETQQSMTLNVLATDQGVSGSLSSQATVLVNVKDVNDNVPEIKVNYQTRVIENVTNVNNSYTKNNFNSGETALRLNLNGPNSDVNGYSSLVDFEHLSKDFQLKQMYQTEFKIVTARKFDREVSGKERVIILCRDNGRMPTSSSATIDVTILDKNDNPPIFSQTHYRASVKEGATHGATVLQVSATDRDEGDNARVLYELKSTESSESNELISIDSNSGLITVAVESVELEDSDHFEYTVVAKNLGTPVKSSNAKLTLQILNSQDEMPAFSLDVYRFSVEENLDAVTPVGKVELISNNKHLIKHSLFYLVSNGCSNNATEFFLTELPFKAEKHSGKIYTKKSLDREMQNNYLLNVMAVQDRHVAPQIACTTVEVKVQDSNDNPPIFTFPTTDNNVAYFSVDDFPGFAVAKLSAVDYDSGKNAQIRFAIESGNEDDLFTLDPTSGMVVL
ncbi:hypothetical protein HELRODRAFT_65492, partial [Helobdella robusta]|uniref:Cadherin domain-containing protein n=1 Tax=Helobdella robusta TaxID=6412 RepID=T1FY86_HELRO